MYWLHGRHGITSYCIASRDLFQQTLPLNFETSHFWLTCFSTPHVVAKWHNRPATYFLCDFINCFFFKLPPYSFYLFPDPVAFQCAGIIFFLIFRESQNRQSQAKDSPSPVVSRKWASLSRYTMITMPGRCNDFWKHGLAEKDESMTVVKKQRDISFCSNKYELEKCRWCWSQKNDFQTHHQLKMHPSRICIYRSIYVDVMSIAFKSSFSTNISCRLLLEVLLEIDHSFNCATNHNKRDLPHQS